MANHRINITLSGEDEKFVKWLAKRDGVSFQQELYQFFSVEFWQCKELYMGEMEQELGE